jgi:hypothetical protein
VPGKTARRYAAALVLLVAAISCSGDDRKDDAAEPTRSPAASATPSKSASPTPAPPAFLPLTGEEAKGKAAVRAALVIKLDNTRPARPQVGLGGADLVVEELVEGGSTRLAAFYHSTLPDRVGPVRSLRTSDIGIVAPTGGVIVASGGAGVAVRALRAGGVSMAAFEEIGYSRDRSRRAPYNLFVAPERVLSQWKEQPAPRPYLQWRRGKTAATAPPGKAVTKVSARFSRSHVTSWTYGDGAWRRTGELAADGDAFEPTTLIVVRVATEDAGYTDSAGNPVPETVTTGTGDATVVIGDRAVTARWSKQSAAATWKFTTADGAALTIPPGRVWIELVPTTGGAVTVS